MSCCETQNLAVGYGAPLLRDIALHAERGKILALIGPNGAGKSTLLKTLAGQLAAQGGAVLLDGQDLTAYTPNARARKLALMLPHTARTELTSCFEVAAAGRYPYTGRLGILSDADRQQVHDALCLVRAEELEDRDFARISDGQRQRVLLARAVCQQPEILLLDEPTSFLDVKGKAELMDILQVLAHEKNVAVIVTLHELELAQRLADAVVCVAPSGVSAVLAPQDAFAQDNICALFGLSTDQYAVLFAGSGAKSKPQFEHYIRSGQRLLRCGYTTGTCAALGAAGAARLLLTGHAPESVGLRTPKGIVVEVAPQFCRLTADGAACAIVKDGGDDIDATTGLPVIAAVTLLPDAPRTVTIDGGAGVGRVTKPGLDQPVGAAAINRVPRQMITEALLREADAVGYGGGFGQAHLQPASGGRGRPVGAGHQRHCGADEPAGASGYAANRNPPGSVEKPPPDFSPRQLRAGLPGRQLPRAARDPCRKNLKFHRRGAGYGSGGALRGGAARRACGQARQAVGRHHEHPLPLCRLPH